MSAQTLSIRQLRLVCLCRCTSSADTANRCSKSGPVLMSESTRGVWGRGRGEGGGEWRGYKGITLTMIAISGGPAGKLPGWLIKHFASSGGSASKLAEWFSTFNHCQQANKQATGCNKSLTLVLYTLEMQPLQPATVGGGAGVPRSFSRASPMLISKPSCPAGAASCRA